MPPLYVFSMLIPAVSCVRLGSYPRETILTEVTSVLLLLVCSATSYSSRALLFLWCSVERTDRGTDIFNTLFLFERSLAINDAHTLGLLARFERVSFRGY